MRTKGGNRIAFRVFLVLLLIAAAWNMMYVYRFTATVPLDEITPRIPAVEQQQLLKTLGSATSEPRLTGARPRYPTDTWHGNVEISPQPDGSYSFIVRTGDQQEPIPLTSFDAWISKAGSKDEKKVELLKNSEGLVTTVQFPEKGDWIIRVRVASGNNSLEFSQRVDVK